MSGTDKVSCLSHKPNSHFFVMYEDFLCIAKVSEHQYKLAAFWRVLETKTNDRITYNQELIEDAKKRGLPEPETNLWIEVPYSEFVNRSLGVYKSSSFQVASAESERLGFSQSRNLKRPKNPLDPDSPLEDYKEYFFHTEVMQKVINGGEYPPPIEINSPLLKSISVRKEKKKADKAIENNSTPLLKSTPPPIEINRINNITEESLKDNEIDYVSADAERTHASAEPNLSTKSHIATTDMTATEDAAYEAFFAPYPPEELSPPIVDKPAKPKKAVKPDENALPPDVEEVIENYKKLFNHPIPISDAIVKAAKELAPCHPTAEKLSEARKWIRDHDNKGYYNKRGGIKLFDIAREWEAWEDAMQQQSQRQQRTDAISGAVANGPPSVLGISGNVRYTQTAPLPVAPLKRKAR